MGAQWVGGQPLKTMPRELEHLCLPQQYQDAIRAHKAGRAVDVTELPVPPGRPCPCSTPPASEPLQVLFFLTVQGQGADCYMVRNSVSYNG